MGDTIIKKIELAGRSLILHFLGLRQPRDTFGAVPSDENKERILIIPQDRIGDTVAFIPAWRQIRKSLPGTKFALLLSKRSMDVLKYEPGIDLVVPFDKSPVKYLNSLWRVRKFRPQITVDLHIKESVTTAIFSVFSGAKYKVRARRGRKSAFNVQVDVPENYHMVERIAKIMSAIIPINVENWEHIALGDNEIKFAYKFWQSMGVSKNKVVGVNISAGKPDRLWSIDKYIEICKKILQKNLTPLILYSPDDKIHAEIVEKTVSGVRILPECPSILFVCAIIDGILALISPDTGTLQVAQSMGIPIVGLFDYNRENLHEWSPWHIKNAVVVAKPGEKIASIEVDDVWNAFCKLCNELEAS